MNEKKVKSITAITSVTPMGQKCIKALIEYDKVIDKKSVDVSCYQVKNRNIVDIEVEDNKVILLLNPDDEFAFTFRAGNPWKGIDASLIEAKLHVLQVKDILSQDGVVIEKGESYIESNDSSDEIADLFIQEKYGNQKYNLFIPRDYDSNRKYPLVQFIHDAAVCGEDTRLAITQGIGATIWATEEEQLKHPCFIFAPQFEGPPIVDDDWNVDERLEDAKRALDHVIETYSIDKKRIYTTGQSMGCMSSIVLNLRYPDFFAASLLIAGQWNERGISGLEKQKLWMICSQGDAKAFPIMNQMCVVMERAGADVSRKVIDAHIPLEDCSKVVGELIDNESNIIFTPLKIETVANGWHSDGGEHHVNTWILAYGIEPIRDWLFSQERGR